MLICSKITVLKHLIKLLFSLVVIILLTSNCARKGTPSGGKKDSLAPLMVTANPPYESLQFESDKIRLYFDEYITLKDINKQLVISPPLKFIPTITPQGSPSKVITINISDTLQENTTYTFNFGSSIQDNNEGNKLERFKYVFSTGDYIDSLKTSGSVKDAFKHTTDKNISILLYKVDSTFTDSIIYKKKPSYVTSTIDTTSFDITNIKKGKYMVIALQDAVSDYIFDPRTDKVGVYDRFITLPEDSILQNEITVFKEVIPFKLSRPKEVSKGKILFGFEGDSQGLKIEIISKGLDDYKSISSFETDKDTLNFWHTIQKDSLEFKVTTDNFSDTVTVFLRSKSADPLLVNPSFNRVLNLRDTLSFSTNNPITAIDTSKMSFVTRKDSLKVPFTTSIDSKSNKLSFLFDKKPDTKYKLVMYPKALTDILTTQNDTLSYLFSTRNPEDYGTINLTIRKSTNHPVIIELLEKKEEVVRRFVVTENTVLNFDLLRPTTYTVRAIIDANGNNKWDTGNYLKKVKPEKVLYHPIVFKVRANWNFNETFSIN